MTDVPSCRDRDREALVAYLYDECEPAERDQVEAHLAICQRCADEAEAFRSVRRSFDAWKVPEQALGLRVVSDRELGESRWRQYLMRPALGLAAAAGVVLGAALALGGVEMRYADDALVFRVGRAAPAPASTNVATTQPGDTPWQPDLVALENQLRRDLNPAVSVEQPPVQEAVDQETLMREVRRLLSESERRQQRERALWLTEFAQELDMQRRADQQQLQQELRTLEGYADYLVRVSR